MILEAAQTQLRPASGPYGAARGTELLAELKELRAKVDAGAMEILANWESRILQPDFHGHALNLAHYIVLRRLDLRGLQDQLTLLGLSSLGRLEGRVIANLDAVIAALAAITGDPDASPFPDVEAMLQGHALTRANADLALGPCSGRRGSASRGPPRSASSQK